MLRALRLVGLAASLCAGAGCPSPASPAPPAGSLTLELGRDGYGIRGVAGDPGGVVYTALASFTDHQSVIAASTPPWTVPLEGTAGPIARSGGLLGVTLGNTTSAAGVALRGSPGAVVVALDPASGAIRWKLAIDASEWSVIASLAAVDGGGLLVGGSFSGTLRAADKVVSSAGKLDGFVARLTAAGTVDWLIRVGGANADAVTGVAAAGGRIAITGTFATGAELAGEPLVATDDKSPATDVFVAELDGQGKRRWSATFGGPRDDSSAGAAIDGRGRLAVAATIREHVKVDVHEVTVGGPSDGLLVFFGKDGTAGPAIPLGGEALDGLQAIVATGDRIVVGGFYAGAIKLGSKAIVADGDDAFVAAFDGPRVTEVWAIAGPGREELAALSPMPGGFVAGIAHTAAVKIDGQPLASPKDPAAGAGVIVRGVR